jgi:two-component system chemotaxis sensor kinase CheA
LILDAFGLAHRAELIAKEVHANATAEPAPKPAEEAGEELLLFGVGARHLAMPLSAVARLEEFPRKSIERAGARDAVQYRGEILPLISMAGTLDVPLAHEPAGMVRAIVYTENGRSAGLVVSEIEDIVREAAHFQRGTPQRGVLGSAVIGSRVTDLIDVRAIIQADDPTFFEEAAV